MQLTKYHLLIITNVILILHVQTNLAKPAEVSLASPVMGPSKQIVTLGPNNVSVEELAYWKRLTSPTLELKYKPHKVYANLVDILDSHEGKAFNFGQLNSDDVQNLIDFKPAESESCSPEMLSQKKATLDAATFNSMPNILNFLKHHMIRQENVCWRTFEVELLSEITEVPKKRRQVVTKLRQSFDGLHPKKSLLEEIDVHSPDFTIALATFMSTYGRDYLEGHSWTATNGDQATFTDIFKKLLYKPCRDVSDATRRFIDYYDQMSGEISTRGFKVVSKKAKQWLASGRICSALLEIDNNSEPNDWDIYKAYLSFELTPQGDQAGAPVSSSDRAIPANQPRVPVPSYDDDDDDDDEEHGQDTYDSDDDEEEEEESNLIRSHKDDEDDDDDDDEELDHYPSKDHDDDDDYYYDQAHDTSMIIQSSPIRTDSGDTNYYGDEEMEDDESEQNPSEQDLETHYNSDDDLVREEDEDEDDEEDDEESGPRRGSDDEEEEQEEEGEGEGEDDDEDQDGSDDEDEDVDDEDDDTDLNGNRIADISDDDDDFEDFDMFEDDDEDVMFSRPSIKKSPPAMPSMGSIPKPQAFTSGIFKKMEDAKLLAASGAQNK